MVKNSSSVHHTIEVDECYCCGGKFLDNNELIKIREEYDIEQERSEDVVQYLYQQVGQELAKQDEAYARAKANRSFLRNLFYKLSGL
jgi:Zn-finger nucleic acid-binding protein